MRKHGMQAHYYADDSQIYMSVPVQELDRAVTAIENSVDDISLWMRQNKLKLNNNKTEAIVFGTRQKLATMDQVKINIGMEAVALSHSVRNLGAYFGSVRKMDVHVCRVCRGANMHIRNIGRLDVCDTRL